MAVRDLAEYLDSGLDYPNVPSKAHPAGKSYRVPSPDAKTGLLLASLGNIAEVAAVGGKLSVGDFQAIKLDDDEERDFYKLVLGCSPDCEKPVEDADPLPPCGSVYHQMVDDGVPWDWFQKIGSDAFMNFVFDEQMANRKLAGRGKATETTPVPNRAEKRAASKGGRKSARASGATASRTPRANTASSSRTGSRAASTAPRKSTAKKTG